MKVKELIEELKKFSPEEEVRYGLKKGKWHQMKIIVKIDNWNGCAVLKGLEG